MHSILRFIIVLFLGAITLNLTARGSNTDGLYLIRIGSSHQIGFSIEGVEGIYTSLHGFAGNATNLGEVRRMAVRVSKFDNINTVYIYHVSKFDYERDLVLLTESTIVKRKKLSSGLNYAPFSPKERKKICDEIGRHLTRTGFRASNGQFEFNDLKGDLSNCKKSFQQLIHRNDVSKLHEAPLVIKASKILDKKVAFDFGAQRELHKGMSGSPILVKHQGKFRLFGMLSFQIGETSGLGIHFDTTGLLDINRLTLLSSLEQKRITEAFSDYRKLAKQFLAEDLCDLEECCLTPLGEIMDDRYYSPNNNAKGELAKRDRRKVKRRNHRKAFLHAYKAHFDLLSEKKGVPFALIYNRGGKRAGYKYPTSMKGNTMLDNFFRALHGIHNDNPEISRPATDRLYEYFAGIPFNRYETDKERRKRMRHLRRDKRFWAKHGLNLELEVRKFLRTQASSMACDSGLAELDSLIRKKSHCEAFVMGTELLSRYCERDQSKRDSIGLMLCGLRYEVLDSADMLVNCALAEIENQNLSCASTALQIARSLYVCVNHYTEADSIQLQILAVDSLVQMRKELARQFSNQAIFNAVNSVMEKLSAGRSSAANGMVRGFNSDSPLGWYERDSGRIDFTFTYGQVDPSKYYLSAFHSGFPPAEYITSESELILNHFSEVLKTLISDSTLSVVFPKDSIRINVLGFADGLPYRRGFEYRGEFDTLDVHRDSVSFYVPEKVFGFSEADGYANGGGFSDLKNNQIFFNGQHRSLGNDNNGLGKNYALSHLRATHAMQVIMEKVGLSKKSIRRISKVVRETDAAGTYRRVELKVTLFPDEEYLNRIRESEKQKECICESLIENSAALMFYEAAY